MSTTVITRVSRASVYPGRSRALAVAGATLAALAVWAIAVPGLGIDLVTRFGSAAPQTVGVDTIVVAAVVGSVLGWGLLGLLERHTARAHPIWSVAAVAVLLCSLTLPFSAATTVSAMAALGAMHLAVAAVLIPSLLYSSSTQGARS